MRVQDWESLAMVTDEAKCVYLRSLIFGKDRAARNNEEYHMYADQQYQKPYEAVYL